MTLPKDAPNLNPQQQEAVESPKKPLLIVAGAGTGKTKTLTSRIAHLIKDGAKAKEICALTFTNKAAKEMQERIKKVVGEEAEIEEAFLGTFHSFGARILRAECRHLNRTPGFVIYDDHDSMQLVKKISKNLTDKKAGARDILNKISWIKNGKINIHELGDSTRPEDVNLIETYRAYETSLEQMNAFDFDDLIVKPLLLISKFPEVKEKYQNKYVHFLVDEYQDVNPAQYKLVKILAEKNRSLTVVGDDHQTIYSWRGSNVETFLRFEDDWPEAKVVILEENYRSSSNIITAASALIAHNERQKPKKLWTQKDPGSLVELVEANSASEEADFVAGDIRENLEKHREKIAILYRTNAQSRAIEQSLIELRIPYLVFGGLKFYERREIKDIVAGVRYVLNPKDILSQERLEKELTKRKFREFSAQRESIQEQTPVAIIHKFLEIFEYMNHIQSLTQPLDRQENIRELIRFASGFTSADQFLEQVTLLQATDQVSSKEFIPRVELMTVHLAKGLEFDRVYVVGVSEGLMPHAWSTGSDPEIEEERRLLYVAMTRARHNLTLSFFDIPSRFISEIPSELLRFHSLTSDKVVFSDDEERYISLD